MALALGSGCGAEDVEGNELDNHGDHVADTASALVDPASNCIGEPADHPVVAYPEPRVFIEAQGWWAENVNGTIAEYGNAEHLHIGACFPLQQTVSGLVRMDFRVVGHNLPAGSLIKSTRVHDGNNGANLTIISWNHTVAAGQSDVTLWKTVNIDTKLGLDGLRETRPLTTVVRPDQAQIHTSGGWCWDVENGTADTNHDSCDRRLTEGRGWYDCFEYKIGRTDEWTYPYAGIPAGQSYTLPVSGRDGAGGTTAVDRHWVSFDPSFHANSLGTFLIDHAGSHTKESLTIPGNLLTAGLHSIFVMAEEVDKCTAIASGTSFPNQIVPQDGRISGGIRIPILVY
jgi:hypothetical protein